MLFTSENFLSLIHTIIYDVIAKTRFIMTVSAPTCEAMQIVVYS